MNNAYSVGVIGGADGPTAIFVTGSFPWELILMVLVCVIGAIWLLKRKK